MAATASSTAANGRFPTARPSSQPDFRSRRSFRLHEFRASSARTTYLPIMSHSRFTLSPVRRCCSDGVRPGVRNHLHVELPFAEAGDRQADAVDGDRPLADEVWRQRGRETRSSASANRPPAAISSTTPTPSTCPSTKWPSRRPSIRIGRSRFTFCPRCSAPSVVTRAVSGPMSASTWLAVDQHHGQAHAVHRQAVADLQVRRQRGLDANADAPFARRHLREGADLFNDAREHRPPSSRPARARSTDRGSRPGSPTIPVPKTCTPVAPSAIGATIRCTVSTTSAVEQRSMHDGAALEQHGRDLVGEQRTNRRLDALAARHHGRPRLRERAHLLGLARHGRRAGHYYHRPVGQGRQQPRLAAESGAAGRTPRAPGAAGAPIPAPSAAGRRPARSRTRRRSRRPRRAGAASGDSPLPSSSPSARPDAPRSAHRR